MLASFRLTLLGGPSVLSRDLPVIGFPVYHALSSAVLGLSGGAATPPGCLRVMPERWFRDMAIRVTTRNRLETCPILSGEAANRRTGPTWLFVGDFDSVRIAAVCSEGIVCDARRKIVVNALEGKTGASSRGNTGSYGVLTYCCG